MLFRVVKSDCAIEMRPRLGEVARFDQSTAHDAMPHHDRDGRPLLLGERRELLRKVAHRLTVKRYIISVPKAVEDRE